MAQARIDRVESPDPTDPLQFRIHATDNEGETHTATWTLPDDIDATDPDALKDYLEHLAAKTAAVPGNRRRTAAKRAGRTVTHERDVTDADLKAREKPTRG